MEENEILSEARKLLGVYDRAEMMVQAGLYKPGTDPYLDRCVAVYPVLDDFFSKSFATPQEAYRTLYDVLKSHLKRGSASMLQAQSK